MKTYESFLGDRIKFVNEVYQQILDIFKDPQKLDEIYKNKSVLLDIKSIDTIISFEWFRCGEQFDEHGNQINGQFIHNREPGDMKGISITILLNPKKTINHIIYMFGLPLLVGALMMIFPNLPKWELFSMGFGATFINTLLSKKGPYFIDNFYLKFPGYFRKLFLKQLIKNENTIKHELVHLYDHHLEISDYSISLIDSESEGFTHDYVNRGTERNAYFVTDFIEFLGTDWRRKMENFSDREDFVNSYIRHLLKMKKDSSKHLSHLSRQNTMYIIDFLEEYWEEFSTGVPVNKDHKFKRREDINI